MLGVAVLPRTVATPSASGEGVLPALPFSEAALASARAAGKPVFAWFTADWCLTCKVNEAAAIERDRKPATLSRKPEWSCSRATGPGAIRRSPAISRRKARPECRSTSGIRPAAEAPRQLPQVLTPAMLAELAAE